MPYRKALDPRWIWSMASPQGCLEWQGVRNAKGYGVVNVRRGKQVKIHRLVWEMVIGPVPDGMNVLHHCDNPPCFRPDHLFLGSDLDNAHDRQAKGRSAKNTGTSNPAAKLTSKAVAEIKAKYATGTYSQKTLGAEYRVSQTAISKVVRNISYYEETSDAPTQAD